MKFLAKCVALTVAGLGAVGFSAFNASAQSPTVSLDPFYEKAAKLVPDGMLGQVLSKESIATTIPGTDAWRIAYVSSDTQERKTVVTAGCRAEGRSSKGRASDRLLGATSPTSY